jgi:hypothetical protein
MSNADYWFVITCFTIVITLLLYSRDRMKRIESDVKAIREKLEK